MSTHRIDETIIRLDEDEIYKEDDPVFDIAIGRALCPVCGERPAVNCGYVEIDREDEFSCNHPDADDLECPCVHCACDKCKEAVKDADATNVYDPRKNCWVASDNPALILADMITKGQIARSYEVDDKFWSRVTELADFFEETVPAPATDINPACIQGVYGDAVQKVLDDAEDGVTDLADLVLKLASMMQSAYNEGLRRGMNEMRCRVQRNLFKMD